MSTKTSNKRGFPQVGTSTGQVGAAVTAVRPGKTGRRCMIDGDECFEVMDADGTKGWYPVHPDVVYGRTGEWKGWSDFLGTGSRNA